MNETNETSDSTQAVAPALRYDRRPSDETPITTADLPATPTRDRNIVATAWIEAPDELLHLGDDLELLHPDDDLALLHPGDDLGGFPVATYKRRIATWLLWRAGPATGDHARYWAADADDLRRQMVFRLYPDGSGEGIGPSGARHTRFRTWKEDLLGRNEPLR